MTRVESMSSRKPWRTLTTLSSVIVMHNIIISLHTILYLRHNISFIDLGCY